MRVAKETVHHAADKSVITFKTAEEPKSYVRTTVPTKIGKCPQKAVDRRINKAREKFTELQES